MKLVLLISLLCHGVFPQTRSGESYGNSGPPILGGAKKKSKVKDLGPTIYEENEVQILVDADWDENLLAYNIYLVLFYEKDCQETAKFIKEFEAAADELIVTKPFTPLAKVDCTEGNKKTTGLCSKIKRSSLPIIKLYRNEEFVMDYSGQRDRQSFINFIASINAEGSKVIENPKDLKRLMKNSTDKFFVSFASKIYKRLHGAYQSIAEEMMPYGVQFYHLQNPKKSKLYPGMDGQIVMFRPEGVKTKQENSTVQFGGKGRTGEDLTKWINESYLGPVGLRNIMNRALYEGNLLVVVYTNTHTGTDQMTHYVKNRAALVAEKRMFTTNVKENKAKDSETCGEDSKTDEVEETEKFCKFDPEEYSSKMEKSENNFLLGMSDKQDFRKEVQRCGFDDMDIESDKVLVCAFRKDGNRYPMVEDFSKDSFDMFVEQLVKNSLKPFIHTRNKTENPRFQFAKELSGYDLMEEMENGNDKVILLIGRKEIDKTGNAELVNAFETAAEELKEDNTIAFAYMDLADNEIAPNLLQEFSAEDQTSIFLIAGKTTRFRPVVGQQNLGKVLVKFIGQR